jgi:hypothetical protein
MDTVAGRLDITMNYATASEHVPEAERNNRTIQERIRATYHNLPYAMIPKIMLRYLAMISTERLDYFPTKGDVAPYLSPHVILTGKSPISINIVNSHSAPMSRQITSPNRRTPTPLVPSTAYTFGLSQIFRVCTK